MFECLVHSLQTVYEGSGGMTWLEEVYYRRWALRTRKPIIGHFTLCVCVCLSF